MTNVEEIWRLIGQSTAAPRVRLIPDLRNFLEKQKKNDVAKLLCNRAVALPVPEGEVRKLELLIAQPEREGRVFSQLVIIDFLRLIYEVIRELNRCGHAIPQIRLADAYRPIPSPFREESVDAVIRLQGWRERHNHWIRDSSKASTHQWLGAIGFSAIVNGALLDKARVRDLLKRIENLEPPRLVGEISSYEFLSPYRGMGNHHLQRWFPDQITEMLIWRHLSQHTQVEHHTADSLILGFIEDPEQATPTKLDTLINAATSWWTQRASPLDLHCTSRQLINHSLTPNTFGRLNNMPSAAGQETLPSALAQQGAAPLSQELPIDDTLIVFPWVAEAIKCLQSHLISPQNPFKTTTAMRTKVDVAEALAPVGDINSDEYLVDAANDLKRIQVEFNHDPIASLYLDWAQQLLRGLSANRNKLSLASISERFCALAPILVSRFGITNPIDLNTPELEDYYSEIMDNSDPGVRRTLLAGAIRDFHFYLHKFHKKNHITNERETLGDEYALAPVDARIISFDDYKCAQENLSKLRIDPINKRAAKLILMLCFKLGLRRMEAFGLTLRDLQLAADGSCIVRKHKNRRLKTISSHRIVPLGPFISEDELNLLIESRSLLDSEGTNYSHSTEFPPLFFPRFAGGEAWVDRISNIVCTALRNATGNDSLFLHHLRHSFGTWTYLRLRAPELPRVADYFDAGPETKLALETGVDLRIKLFGRNLGVSRKYAFAVARLLGHSSPGVSLGHYVHSSDVVLSCIARREVSRLEPLLQIAASGLGRSVGYEYLRESDQALVRACRRAALKVSPRLVPTSKLVPLRGRPKSVEPHLQTNWVPLATIKEILVNRIDFNSSALDISAETGLSPALIDQVLYRIQVMTELAEYVGPLPAKEFLRFRLKKYDATDIVPYLECKLAALQLRAPVLFKEGIRIYLSRFDPDWKDVVFRSQKDAPELIKLMRFFEKMDLDPTHFCWIRRLDRQTNDALPSWVQFPNVQWVPTQTKRVLPKVISENSPYYKWVGLTALASNGRSLGKAFAEILFLAQLNLDIHING